MEELTAPPVNLTTGLSVFSCFVLKIFQFDSLIFEFTVEEFSQFSMRIFSDIDKPYIQL